MKNLFNTPFSSIKTMHFCGIGGIGMSGLAELFFNLGYNIQGSDIKENYTIRRLRERGIKIFIGHDKKNIHDVDIIVVSSAINESNEEYKEALHCGIPIFKRSKMLSELMRFKWSIVVAGTHGKTTTTSLISHIMHHAKLDPTAVIGGIINSWGKNSMFGEGNWIVAESDESDGSFLDLPATISIVTNIEEEHMEYYGTYDNLKDYFIRFISNSPFFGLSVLCVDNDGVQDIIPFVKQRKVLTYGVSPQADYRVSNIAYTSEGSYFDIECNIKGDEKLITDYFIPMYGRHNVLNATAAVIVAEQVGVETNLIKESLADFSGIKRRFTKIDKINNTLFIDDYAHHPSEIEAVITASNQLKSEESKLLSVVQPHKYTRLRDHFDSFCKCFNKSDFVFILDVYKGNSYEIKEYSAPNLVDGIKKYGHKNVFYVQEKDLYKQLMEIIINNKIDIVSFMGAGNISELAIETVDRIKKTL